MSMYSLIFGQRDFQAHCCKLSGGILQNINGREGLLLLVFCGEQPIIGGGQTLVLYSS